MSAFLLILIEEVGVWDLLTTLSNGEVVEIMVIARKTNMGRARLSAGLSATAGTATNFAFA